MTKELEFFRRHGIEKYFPVWELPRVQQFLELFGPHPNPHLVLDYDGTLAPFNLDPAQAVPYEGVREILDALRATRVRCTIATGRPVREVVALLQLSRPIEIHGLHGWEHLLETGEVKRRPLTLHHHDAINTVKDWRFGVEAYGARVEVKDSGVVFHWRGLTEKKVEAIEQYLEEKWAGVKHAFERYLAPYSGDGNLEFRAQGWHKGRVMEELYEPEVPMVFLGDDHTDEDGFFALKRYGEIALSVFVEQRKRRTDADIRLRPPVEMITFLAKLLTARVRGGWGATLGAESKPALSSVLHQ